MSFDRGFSFGLSAFQQAEDNKRQDDRDARAKQEFAWKEKDRARTDAERAREDGVWAKLEPAPAPAAAMPTEQAEPAVPAPSGSPAQGLPVAAPQPPAIAASTTAGQMGTATAAARPAASRAEQLQALESIAIARRDASSLERIGAARQGAEDDEFMAKTMKGYTGGDDQIGATAQYLNGNSKSITMGAPDKNGVVSLSVVTPDRRAQFMNLSRPEQARLYAAAQLMERNPARAYREMAEVNKPLADALAAENGLATKVTDTNNNAAFKGRDDARADRQQAETVRHNRASESIATAKVSAATGAGRAFDPQAGFDSDQAYKTALDMVRKESEGALGKQADPKQMADRVQAVYGNLRDTWATENVSRQRATAFASEARKATTSEEVEAVRAKALQRGYSEKEMAGLDPRFGRATPSSQAPAATAPRAVAPPAPPSAPASSTPAKKAADPVPDSPVGQAVDVAKAELKAAVNHARTFGLSQRKADPAGYEAAVKRVRDAEAAEQQADSQWQSQMAKQGVGAYFGGMR